MLQWTLIKHYCYFKSVHFRKKSGRLSSAVLNILAFVGHFSANFKPILDCLIPNTKLKYEDSENINADCVNTVVFNLRQIKRRTTFLGHLAEWADKEKLNAYIWNIFPETNNQNSELAVRDTIFHIVT